jgi:hypothetical protein
MIHLSNVVPYVRQQGIICLRQTFFKAAEAQVVLASIEAAEPQVCPHLCTGLTHLQMQGTGQDKGGHGSGYLMQVLEEGGRGGGGGRGRGIFLLGGGGGRWERGGAGGEDFERLRTSQAQAQQVLEFRTVAADPQLEHRSYWPA